MEQGKTHPRSDRGFKIDNGNPVRKIDVTTGCQYYRVDLRHSASGRSVRKSFSTPKKAASFASRCMARLCGGRDNTPPPVDQQREALKILSPFKVSLQEAARFYAEFHDAKESEAVAVAEPVPGADPDSPSKHLRQREQPPSIYSPADVRRMMNAAEPELLPYLALSMFLGVGTGQLLRIKWKDVDFERMMITLRIPVPGKRSRNKPVPMTPNLMQFLLPFRDKPNANIVPHDKRSLQRWMKKLLQELDIQPIYKGAYHTFIAYHLALHPLTETMRLLGFRSSTTLLRYCRLCSDDLVKQAEAFFEIEPHEQGEIIPLKHRNAA